MTSLHQQGKEKHNEGLEGSKEHGDQKEFQRASEYKDAGKGSKPYRKTCRPVINSIPHAQGDESCKDWQSMGKGCLKSRQNALILHFDNLLFPWILQSV